MMASLLRPEAGTVGSAVQMTVWPTMPTKPSMWAPRSLLGTTWYNQARRVQSRPRKRRYVHLDNIALLEHDSVRDQR